jgi:methyl-accepting chemotaxis protein
MEGTHLTNAADRLDELATQVQTFTNTASEKAMEVADQVRQVAGELRSMAEAVSGTTGTVEQTPPAEGTVGIEGEGASPVAGEDQAPTA